MNERQGTTCYRAIFVSDIHLGTRSCQAPLLLDFLRSTRSESLYLVGDVVDGWRLRRNWYWPQSHNDVVQEVLRIAQSGTRVLYVPGNHDAFARDYAGLVFGAIEVAHEHVHRTADGRCFLVVHGDACDMAARCRGWLRLLGSGAHGLVSMLNTGLNRWRQRWGYPYWSLAHFVKTRVRNAASFIQGFECAVADLAASRGMDGVICGHIHHAAIRDIGGILYCNDGDWVESCTALAEDQHGRLEIIPWGRALDLKEPVSATRPLYASWWSRMLGTRRSTVSSARSIPCERG